MAAPFIVEYQGQKLRATVLAKRFGVTPECIIQRWRLGMRGHDLVTRDRRRRVPIVVENPVAESEPAIIDPNAQSKALRKRAREKAASMALALAAECQKPLIDAKLLTEAEREENERKVRGVQRWNGSWFGESRDSRESGRS